MDKYFPQMILMSMQVLKRKWVKIVMFGNAWIAFGQLKTGHDCGSILKPSMSSPQATHVKFVTSFVHQKGGWLITKPETTEEQPILTFLFSFLLDFDDLVKSKTWKDEEGNIRCSDCDYFSKFLTNVKNHIEAHHVQGLNQGYSCNFCSKVFKSKNSFQTHKSRFKGKCSQHVF